MKKRPGLKRSIVIALSIMMVLSNFGFVLAESAGASDPEADPVPETFGTSSSGSEAGRLSAQAQDEVFYLDKDGQRQFIDEYTEVTSSTTQMSDGWYVVRGDVRVGRRIDVTGTVHLLLCDNAALYANDGIYVSAEYGGDLTICAQSRTGNAGSLYAHASSGSDWAGIGGNSRANGGYVTILGGRIEAVGGKNAAGIGGGDSSSSGHVRIYAGIITAKGGDNAAGIGGGEDRSGSDVTISGGTVTAQGGARGAGIGGGKGGSQGGTVTINGGEVKATGGHQAAGIGGGQYSYGGGEGGAVSITGGTVEAAAGTALTADNEPVAIGRGGNKSEISSGNLELFEGAKVFYGRSASSLEPCVIIPEPDSGKEYSNRFDDRRAGCCSGYPAVKIEKCDGAAHLEVKFGDRNGHGSYCRYCRQQMDEISAHSWNDAGTCTVCSYDMGPVKYLDENGRTQECTEYKDAYRALQAGGLYRLSSGWYVARGEFNVPERIEVTRDAKLILCDGAKMKVDGGIFVNGDKRGSLTIYAQSDVDQAGYLQAIEKKGESGAGIGGDEEYLSGNISIHGGRIYAKGMNGGAGIGGASGESQYGDIVITGGSVKAEADPDDYGAGIGGGSGGSGGYIKISGGLVNAIGDVAIGAGSPDASTGYLSIPQYAIVSYSGIKETLKTPVEIVNGKEVNDERVNICRTKEDVIIRVCEGESHSGTYYQMSDGHKKLCKYCGYVMEEKQPHVSDGTGSACSVCGCHVDFADIYYVEQNADGSWSEPENPAERAAGIYTAKDKEHFRLTAYSSSFESSAGDRTAAKAGDSIELSADDKTLYVYYERNVNDLTFCSDIAGTKVAVTKRVRYGEDLSKYKDEAVSLEDHSFAGWSETPKTSGRYSYKDTIPDDDPSKTEADIEKHPYIIYGFDGTMPDEEKKLYPVFIQDRLEVHLDMGAYDGENSCSWYDRSRYDRNTPAYMNEPGGDGKPQSREFVVNINEKIDMTAMKAAVRDGYELAGWYTQEAVPWDETWGVTSKYCDKDRAGNPIKKRRAGKNYDYYTVTLTAGWRPVEIAVAYDAGEHGSGTVPEGRTSLDSSFTLASAPAADPGYMFTGWADKNGRRYGAGQEVTFTDWSLTENGVLRFTAQYERVSEEEHTVIFDSAGGSYVRPVRAKIGDKVDRPADPSRKGCTFAGWYLGETDAPAQFPVTVGDEDIVLTAHWTAREYTLTLNAGGGRFKDGETSTEVRAAFGDDISGLKPDDPTWEHYDFVVWGPEYPDTMPAEDLVLQAIWKPSVYSITLDSDGGSFSDGKAVKTIEDIYDAEVTAPEDPEKSGCVFEGWTLDGERAEIPVHMPDSNPVYKAEWHVHIFGDWETIKDAKETEPGIKRRECSTCHVKEYAEIPAKGASKASESGQPQLGVTYVKDLKAVSKFRVRAGKKKASLKWKKPSKRIRNTYSGYEIQYSSEKSFKDPVTRYAGRNSKKKVIKGLKRKKTCYVRMRAYRKDGNVIHVSKWTKKKKVRVR